MFTNNFAWSIATHFSASGWTFECKFCSICSKMILTVSYFLNTGAKTRWCRSRGASAKFEKTIKLIYEHELPQQIELMIMHLLVHVFFYIIFLLLDCVHCDDKAPSDDN